MVLTAKLIVAIMAIFSVIAAIDDIVLGNRLGLGSELKRGVRTTGDLILSMAGIIALVPILSSVMERTLVPLWKIAGLDPSSAAGTILAIDMGGYDLAHNLALNELCGIWSGIITASTIGATIIFTIPVGFAAVSEKRRDAFIIGIICGLSATPFSLISGGLMLGLDIKMLIINTVPCVVFSIIIIVFLTKMRLTAISVFTGFAKVVNGLALSGLVLAIIRELILVPFDIRLATEGFFGMITSSSQWLITCGSIALILSGAFPFIFILRKALSKPFELIRQRTGLSDACLSGILISIINNLPLFSSFDEMTERETALNTAFTVCAAFALGDHLAFASVNAPEAVTAMVISKIVGGICGMIIAVLIYKKKDSRSV